MADTEIENIHGFVDKRKTQGSASLPVDYTNNYLSVSRLRIRLTAALPAYYTSTRLDGMTKNDMVYAVRTLDDAAGI